MKMRCILVLATLLFPSGALAGTSLLEQLENERKALFDSVADGVVFIQCGKAQFGSGFFVDSSGVIVTNRHVVDCNEKVSVILRGGEKRKAEVATTDSLYDLALLKVKVKKVTVRSLPLADSDVTQVGDYAAAVSHPVGGVWTLNEGIISNRYPAQHDQYAGIIQTQVPLQPGSSGGPVINRFGQVVCVVTAKLSQGDNTGFCIQSNLVKRLLSQYRMKVGGQLAINGDAAGAEVFINGEMKGTLPALLTLEPGNYNVEVRQGRLRYKNAVALEPGGIKQLFIKKSDLR